uniref:Phospholipid-transporting ATPase n=1 Tax=Panagrolaimus sp. PS1159 TaxID=55785 RepID=A0AC35FWC6_9BILA
MQKVFPLDKTSASLPSTSSSSSSSSSSSTFPVHPLPLLSQQFQNRTERPTLFPSTRPNNHQRRASSASTERRVSFIPEVRENIYSVPPETTTFAAASKRLRSQSYGGPSTSFGNQPLNSVELAAAAAYRQHAAAVQAAQQQQQQQTVSEPIKSSSTTLPPPQHLQQQQSTKPSKKQQFNCCKLWSQKMVEIFSNCFGNNSKKRNNSNSSHSEIVGEQERVLKANDRTFNAQFKYADNFIKTSKYNVVTFIPKNLFEQFQRLANFYFLVLMILQFIPWITSIVWYSTAIPLFIVLAFSAIKDGYDDIQRHRSDNQVNKPHGLCYIETAELDGETNLKTRSALPETVPLGDIVRDISNFDGQIQCEAPNNRLDRFEGKITYKGTPYPISNENLLLRGCRLRNTRWCYGVVVFAGRESKLMMNSGKTTFKRTSLDRFLNILIMGIVLFLIAMCLICTILCGVWEWVTGRHFQDYLEWDRSIVPNTGEKGSRQIAIISFLMFFSYIILLNTVVPISLYVSVEILRFVHSLWINFDTEMYDEKMDTSARARTTTLNEELGQVQYIFSDKTGTLTQNIMTFNKCSINGRSYGDVHTPRGELVDIDENTPSIDFSSNKWSEPSFKFYDKTLVDDTKRKIKEVEQFWRLLALCHTVMPERKAGSQLEYQAQSPDEAALTSAARNFGFVFKSRTPQSITIEVNGKEEIYEVLHLLDFDNVRKRMSVIVKSRKGKLTLYCKGADTIILDMVKSDTSSLLKDATMKHLDKFASDGLRTLCVAYKDLEESYVREWLKRLKEANLDRYNKDEKVDKLYEEIEKDLTLLGATAIEDKLQDQVPQTIAKLAAANIKIWVLTGDKTETAINIGYSCRLLTEDMKEIFVIDGKTEEEVEVQLKDIRRRIERGSTIQNAPGNSSFYDNTSRGPNYNYNIAQFHSEPGSVPTITTNDVGLSKPKEQTSLEQQQQQQPREQEDPNLPPQEGFALVINGNSLVHALKPKFERMFLEIGCLMISVICCRVTPLQKAQVVDLVKRNKKAVTLSVGDGANDVSMIKTAHIGVGISGQEGMQAVLASDFSIAQFRFLQRLLLVHGRWSYFRMSKFLRYFFYKNFSFTLTHFWYSFFSGYSAQTIYDPVLISCYNLFFTSLPVLAMGIFDQDVNDEYSLAYPKLYIPGQYNLFFNMRIFIYSVFHGIASSLIIFFVPYGALFEATDHTGRDMNDYPMLAFTTFTALIVVVTGQIMLDTAYWTVFTFIVLLGSLAFYLGLVIILYEVLPVKVIASTQASMSYGVVFRAFSSSQFWFSLLMVTVVLLLPIMLNRFFWFDTHPSYADRLRVRHKLPKGARGKEVPDKQQLPRTAATRRSRRGSLRSGYAFSHSQGFGELIAKGKLFKNIEHLRMPSNRSSPTKKGLAPIIESPPGLIAAVATVPQSNQQSRPTSRDESRSQSGLAPIIESPPGLIAAVATVPQSNQQSRPTSRDESRSQSVMSTPHSIIVNQDDEPLPTFLRNDNNKPAHPGYTSATVPRSTPREVPTHFPAYPPNIPPTSNNYRRQSNHDHVTSSPMPLPASSNSSSSSASHGPRFVGRQRINKHLETEV